MTHGKASPPAWSAECCLEIDHQLTRQQTRAGTHKSERCNPRDDVRLAPTSGARADITGSLKRAMNELMHCSKPTGQKPTWEQTSIEFAYAPAVTGTTRALRGLRFNNAPD